MKRQWVSNSPYRAKKSILINIRLAYCLAALAAFTGGGMIYAFFRNIDSMILFQYITKPSLFATPVSFNTDTIWGYLFVFNLLHGLWCLSGLLVIRAIWLTNAKWRVIYGGTFIAVASFLEIMQLNESFPGTFDKLDLASYGVFALLESITYNKFVKRRIL
jgi:hypothetical protein